jgi:parallel beta-helix repeat protein
VIGNVVDNVGPYPNSSPTIHGIYAAGPDTIVWNNIVTRAAGAGIHAWHSATRNILSNNTVANCAHWGILIGGGSPAGNNTVNNNIVVNNGGGGVGDAAGLDEYDSAAGPNNVFDNNVVYNNRVKDVSLITGTQSGTITLNAAQFSSLFLNYTGDMSGNYHLQSGAAAINAGTTACAAGVINCVPPTDFDGVARPKGTAYCVGAYEY